MDLHERREAAERVRRRCGEEVAALRADGDLSSEGLQRKLAEAYAKARAELKTLASSEQTDLVARKATLEQRFFGTRKETVGDPASQAISARDAADRAAQLQTPAEAMDLLQRAESNGDDILAAAVVRHALASSSSGIRQVDDRWDEVGRAYLDARPHLMPVAEELAEIEQLTERQIFSPFTLPEPYGVAPQYINAATSDHTETRDSFNATLRSA
jgi:hypothetical protein